MKKLLFATGNKDKLREVRKKLEGLPIELLGLTDFNWQKEIPETQDTIAGNARQKAEFVHETLKFNVFADDTGLEVPALNNEPGVYSARYAGMDASYSDNVNLLLKNLQGNENRKARFVTVIALFWEAKYYEFEGEIIGEILKEKRGKEGFGYDPIFQPDGYDQSFSEMPLSLKNEISHRGRAVNKLMDFIAEQL